MTLTSVFGMLLILLLTFRAAAAPPAPSSSYKLYVEGSAPGSGELKSPQIIDDPTDIRLPGYNTMLHNQTSLKSVKKPEPDPALGIQLEGVCKHITLGGNGKVGETSLDAECVDPNGQWWDTSLNLNDCVANDGGRLIFREE